MKKVLMIMMILTLSVVAISAEKFTFQGYDPESTNKFKTNDRVKVINGGRFSFPSISGSPKISGKMNKEIAKLVNNYDKKGTKYQASYEVTGSNAKFISILFTIDVTKDGVTSKLYDAVTLDVATGKELRFPDLFLSGYQDSMDGAVSDKVKQFGIEKTEKFRGVDKKQKYYLTDTGLVIFYNPYEATNFGTGDLFLPFEIADLIGIIR